MPSDKELASLASTRVPKEGSDAINRTNAAQACGYYHFVTIFNRSVLLYHSVLLLVMSSY
jgi:hypothetical protein